MPDNTTDATKIQSPANQQSAAGAGPAGVAAITPDTEQSGKESPMLESQAIGQPCDCSFTLEAMTSAHPTAKRGAQNTGSTENAPKDLILDYLRGTLPALQFTTVEDQETGEVITFAEPNTLAIESVFGTMTPLEHNAAQGYTHSAILPCGGTVHWHEKKPEQRVLINLGGRALAELGIEPLELLDRLEKMEFQVTRMDWARDDREKLLDLGEIRRKLEAGEIVTRFKSFGVNVSAKIGSAGQDQGMTIYVGDRTSEAFCRIYDKAAEQGEEGDWLRFEVEFKKRKAQELLSQILTCYRAGEGVGELILGVIYGLVDFKEVSQADTNKSRWETSAWWSEFLRVGEKVKVTVGKIEVTLERAKDWLYGQVGIVAAMVNELEPEFIAKAIEDGLHRMKERHLHRLERWRAEFKKSAAGQIIDFQKEVSALGAV